MGLFGPPCALSTSTTCSLVAAVTVLPLGDEQHESHVQQPQVLTESGVLNSFALLLPVPYI